MCRTIGDIQGCFDSFRRLLDLCRFDPAAITVLGNHDLYLLMVAEGGAKYRGKDDTLQPILDAPDCGELLDWLRRQPLCHTEDGYCLVHAGLLPQWTAEKACALAREVEATLTGDPAHYREFILNLWGSEPAAWSDDLSGWARLRVIVNAMTRMRFCSPQGVMEFHTKGEVAKAPPGYLPWFEVPGRQSADTVLVTGHWSALGLKLLPNLLALDSGCLWGGHLTAVRLEDRRLFQVDCSAGEARPLC